MGPFQRPVDGSALATSTTATKTPNATQPLALPWQTSSNGTTTTFESTRGKFEHCSSASFAFDTPVGFSEDDRKYPIWKFEIV